MKKLNSKEDRALLTSESRGEAPLSGTAVGKKKPTAVWGDALSALGLTALVLFFFFRTVFLGMPISKICRMAEWDSIYSAYATGKSMLCDPSIIHLLIPHYFVVAKLWNAGHLPLWNPYIGCGAPLVGDIQATIFSPTRLLFTIWPSMYSYNLSLVLLVALAVVTSFILGRSLGLSRWASSLVAVAYALCPYQLFYLELLSGFSYGFFPLTFYAFARAAKLKTVGSFIACGIMSAVLIISGHPELSFFGIFFASLLMAFLVMTGATQRHDLKQSGMKKTTVIIWGLVIAGISAFCLAAPVLLPFVEFLKNSDCYKFEVGISAFVPWQCVLYNLLQPGFLQASPYLGIVVAAMAPVAFTTKGKSGLIVKSLLGIALMAFILMTRIGPMDIALRYPPLLWLVTVYCVPFFLLAIALMAGFGMDAIFNEGKPGLNKLILLSAGLLLALVVPFALSAAHVSLRSGDFDLILPHMAFDPINWTRDCILALGLIVVLILNVRIKNFGYIAQAAVLIIAFAGMAILAKPCLPLENRFNYPLVEPLPFLQQQGERVLGVGEHLLRANTNAVYGIADLRDFNVLFPRGYRDFAEAAGAKLALFAETFDDRISKLIDLASVKYILSQTPIESVEDNGKRFTLIKESPGTYKLFENESALPQAYLVHDCLIVDSSKDALALIADKRFDQHKQVVIETPVIDMANDWPSARLNSPLLKFEDSVVTARPGPNEVVITAKTNSASALVLTDTFYPGWKAYLDGKEVPIFKANYMFRAIALPVGQHQVRFRYEPISFFVGALLALTFMLLVILLGTFGKSILRRSV